MIARPLQRLTEQDRAFSWSLECDTAFATLNNRLTSAPVLVYPDYSSILARQMPAKRELGLYYLRSMMVAYAC